jgi:hypothetical protein
MGNTATDNNLEPSLHWFKLMLRTLFESVIVVGLVVLFFITLITLLNHLFPIGTGLKELMQEQQASELGGRSKYDLWIQSKDGVSNIAPAGNVAALLSSTRGSVKNKRADTLVWKKSKQNMGLYDRDAVQTGTHSYATITFDSEHQLSLGPDTLVIVNRLEEDFLFKDRQSSLVLVAGELHGVLNRHSKKETKLTVSMLAADVNISSIDNASMAPVKFKIRVNEDNSSTLMVTQGSAEISVQGVSRKVLADQIITVQQGEIPPMAESLPDQVYLKSPASNKKFYYRDIPNAIRLKWKSSDAAQYRLEMSRDSSFQETILSEVTDKSVFKHSNLYAGQYYWRVVGINESGSPGEYSKPRSLTVVQDIEPPLLDVIFPDGPLTDESFLLKGSTEAGVTLYIDGVPHTINRGGQFEQRIKLKQGFNIVVVEAIDIAGNTNYQTQLLHRKKSVIEEGR